MRSVISIIENGSSDGTLVRVECHLSNSLPMIVIVGFTHRSIAESKERIRGALASSGVKLPAKRIIVNLAPADIPKHGSSFDLPILIAILSAANIGTRGPDQHTVVMGEVGLDGTIRPIRGVIGKILAAQAQGITSFWVPSANAAQARLVPGVRIYAFETVRQLYQVLTGAKEIHVAPYIELQASRASIYRDDVVGQVRAKRALMIAAAGHHNVLLSGPPGTGKSMLAQQLLPLLPAMTQREVLDVTHLSSLTGRRFDQIITQRPFRSPHHSASPSAILGGSAQLRPGEVSLSHHGILFLDELPEFSRTVIEGLREPLEDQCISIARTTGSITFPAHFLLIATANPCPCGHYGTNKSCTCSMAQLAHYKRKLSGPILDRIDLYSETETIDHRDLLAAPLQEPDNIVKQIHDARAIQHRRIGKLNSQLTNYQLKQHAHLEPPARLLLDNAAARMSLSARSYIRTLRVARTIADLDNNRSITEAHVGAALQYRQKDPHTSGQLTSVP